MNGKIVTISEIRIVAMLMFLMIGSLKPAKIDCPLSNYPH